MKQHAQLLKFATLKMVTSKAFWGENNLHTLPSPMTDKISSWVGLEKLKFLAFTATCKLSKVGVRLPWNPILWKTSSNGSKPYKLH